MATLQFDGVSKVFPGGAFGVRELSLEVPHGAFLTLVGPSGCGKSTTLNLIAGLEQPTSGRILIDGVDVTKKPPGERDVAMVFQSYALYPHLDVRGNLAFPLKVAGLPKAEIEARVAEVAERTGLAALLSRKPRELSGGQRQRVALGRALVRRPKLFLFDEPLSNLDAGLRGKMRGELSKLHESLGTTFVYVTHDQGEAMTLSSLVVVMRDARVEQVGTPRELYERPANTFVARFFGSPPLNLVPGGLFADAAPTVGLRPEELEVGFGEAPPGALPGTVWLSESFGADAFVTVQVGDERLSARAPGDTQARSGDAAWVRPLRPLSLRFDERGVKLP